MGDQPTNGPYHWGNGPQPKGSGGSSRGVSALAVLLVAGPACVFVALVGYLATAYAQ